MSVMTEKRHSPPALPLHADSLPFPHLTGYWVNRLAGAFRTVVDREIRELDLTRRQGGMLFHIERAGTPTATDLTRALGVDSTAVTRMLDRLADKGLVLRRPDPEDGRRQLVELTEQARELLPLLHATASRVEALFESEIEPGDLAAFHRVLMGMLANVGQDYFAMLDDTPGGEGGS